MKKATSILLICGMITGGMMLSGCESNYSITDFATRARKAIIKCGNSDKVIEITDWEYKQSGLFKLYLANGGEVVTHASNVFIVNGELE